MNDNITGDSRQFLYDTLNRVTTAADLTSNTNSTGTITIGGTEKSKQQFFKYQIITIYDTGTITASVNDVVVGSAFYGETSTDASLASALASAINSSGTNLVSASASGDVVTLTSLGTGL
jgi:hypothetical protein